MQGDLDAPLFEDFRGKIIRNNINGIKFNTLLTYKDMYRGGESHTCTQYLMILSGQCEITVRNEDKDNVMIKGPNELIIIQPNTPHLFLSLTESLIIEWWDGPFDVSYYPEYRRLVEGQIENHQE